MNVNINIKYYTNCIQTIAIKKKKRKKLFLLNCYLNVKCILLLFFLNEYLPVLTYICFVLFQVILNERNNINRIKTYVTTAQ